MSKKQETAGDSDQWFHIRINCRRRLTRFFARENLWRRSRFLMQLSCRSAGENREKAEPGALWRRSLNTLTLGTINLSPPETRS